MNEQDDIKNEPQEPENGDKKKRARKTPPPPPGGLHRWVGRPLIRAVRLFLLLVVATVVMLYAFYHFNRQDVLMLLGNYVKNQTGRLFTVEVTFSRLEPVNFGHFIFHDLKIQDPFIEDSLLLSCQRAEVKLDPLTLIGRGGVRLSAVELFKGRIWIHRERDGQGPFNIQRLFKGGSGKGGDGTSVRIGNGLLQEMHVRLDDIARERIDNQVNYLECKFTRIGGENLIEVHGSSIVTSYWSMGSVKVTGIYTIKDDVLRLRGAHLVKGATDLRGDGYIDFAKNNYDLKILPGKLELGHLPPKLGFRKHLEGTVRVSSSIQGTFEAVDIEADITMESGSLFGYQCDQVACRLTYNAGKLTFDRVSLDTWGGHVQDASVAFRFGEQNNGYTVDADVRDMDIARLGLRPLEKLRGRISGRFTLDGAGYEKSSMTLSGETLKAWGDFEGFQIDSAAAAFDYADSKVRIDRLTLHSGPTSARAIGDVENWDVFLFVVLEQFPMPRAEKYVGLDSLSGTGDFSGTLTGELGDPQLKGSFTVTDGSYKDLLFTILEGDCRLQNMLDSVSGEINMDFHSLQYAGQQWERMQITGTLPDTAHFIFEPLILTMDSSKTVFTRGTFQRLSPSGAPIQAVLNLDSLSASFHGRLAVSNSALEVFLNGDTIEIPAASVSMLGGQVLGSVRYTGADWVDGAAEFSGIELALLPSIIENQPPVSGHLHGSLSLSGSLFNPDASLQAVVDSLQLAAFQMKRIETEVRINNKRIQLERLLLTADSSHSVLAGELPYAMLLHPDDSALWGDQSVAIRAVLDKLPLSSIRSATLPVRTGRLDGVVDVSGTASNPQLEGELLLSDGSGVISPINLRLQQVNGRLVFSPGSVVLDSLRSVSPEGRVTVHGRMTMAGLKPDNLQLSIVGRDLILQQFKYVTSIRVNADLKASGSITAPLIEGQVHIVQGEINPLIGSPVAIGGSDELVGENDVKLPVSPINYNLRFTTSDDFWLRNRNANIKLGAAIEATQLDGVPRISGSINAVTGTYTLYGRRFRIRYGVLRFQGQPELNPLLDIEAERTVRGQVRRTDLLGGSFVSRGSSGPSIPGEQYEMDRNTFILHIGGTLNSPQFVITVRDREDRAIDPPLTEEQSRTLVILDQTWREFQQQSTYSQSKLLDQAANMALNQANPYLQEWTGLDELSFESQLFNPATGDQSNGNTERSAKITMGEFLFENVFFSVSQDIIDPSARSAQIEYLINRHSSIISQTDSRGHFSIDYRFRIRY